MAGYRPQRMAEQIHQILSELLTFGVKDPGLAGVTLTGVEMTRDVQLARVFYTVLGDEAERREARRALERATPFMRHTLGEEMQVRLVPELRFTYDSAPERGRRIDELLRQVGQRGDDDTADS